MAPRAPQLRGVIEAKPKEPSRAMSKQLAMSIAACFLAMSAYVLLGGDAYSACASSADNAAQFSIAPTFGPLQALVR